MDLYDERQEYDKARLSRADLTDTPEPLFERWLNDAQAANVAMANAMTLSTVDTTGQPFQRIVLLKSVTPKGLVFFTNLHSRKAQQMAENAKVSLLFFWPQLERQIHITGIAKRTATTEDETYFHSRPRESQLAALASHQSNVIDSREALLARYHTLSGKYPDTIPAPDFWGGYRVSIDTAEFWQGGSFRLHDRFLYQKTADKHWLIERLSP